MNNIATNKKPVNNPFDFGMNYTLLDYYDTLLYDTNSEIIESAIGGLFKVCKVINISYYDNNINWFIDYYTDAGYDVIVDSEEDDGDGNTIYYIIISWKEVKK
jgi:hypothetical protein